MQCINIKDILRATRGCQKGFVGCFDTETPPLATPAAFCVKVEKCLEVPWPHSLKEITVKAHQFGFHGTSSMPDLKQCRFINDPYLVSAYI